MLPPCTRVCYSERVLEVLSVRDLRVALTRVIRDLGGGGRPVFAGPHRKAEVVLMSVRDYEALAAGLGPEAGRRAREVASATGSVLAELPGRFSAEEETDVEAYINGDIDAHEAAERTVARWRERSAIRAR